MYFRPDTEIFNQISDGMYSIQNVVAACRPATFQRQQSRHFF
nr:hypothetical protein [Vibrio alginolyticus]